MQESARERWNNLREQASTEQDPERLVALLREIDRLLEREESRARKQRASGD